MTRTEAAVAARTHMGRKPEYYEGQTVKIIRSQDSDGCQISAGDVGTLMTDMGEGDWLVNIPAKGSPLLREGVDFTST